MDGWSGVKVLFVAAALLGMSGPFAAEARKPWLGEIEQAIKARWLGKSESSVTAKLGPPKERTPENKNAAVTWSNQVSFGGGRDEAIRCSVMILFQEDRLAEVTLVGDDQNLCRKLVYPLIAATERQK